MKSKVFKLAHQVKSNFENWSEALKFAWAKIKLQIKLRMGVHKFSFVKKSTGELREALGTLQSDLINYEAKGGSWEKWNILRFYDLDAKGWRCLDVRTLKHN